MQSAAKKDNDRKYYDKIREFEQKIQKVVLDVEKPVRLLLCSILARGHVLIEDQPGMGKTTLVKTVGHLLDLDMNRVQFTNDLLPADILGVNIFDQGRAEFKFMPGPVFSNILLADELNRASPKTQSATLQAMEEGAVSIDGVTHPLPQPFIVIGTQNPNSSIGTFPLPESQMDRFLMRLSLGYPGRDAEKRLLTGEKRTEILEKMEPMLQAEDLLTMQKLAGDLFVSEKVVDYVQDILEETRRSSVGLSTRAGLGMISASRAHAYLENRDFVLPEDVQAVAIAVMNHRLGADLSSDQESAVLHAKTVLDKVSVP